MANVGSSVFLDLKISLEPLKSQGNLTSSTSGNPDLDFHEIEYQFGWPVCLTRSFLFFCVSI